MSLIIGNDNDTATAVLYYKQQKKPTAMVSAMQVVYMASNKEVLGAKWQ